MYVYKVVGNFDENIYPMLQLVDKEFTFMYVNRVLLIALRDCKNNENGAAIIEDIKSKGFFVEEVDEKNIVYLNDTMKEWCQENLIRIDTQRYEEEHQDTLKAAWQALDKIEEELKQLQANRENNRKEVDTDGEEGSGS